MRYDTRWPERHFWLAGDLKVEPQPDRRLRVTFPLTRPRELPFVIPFHGSVFRSETLSVEDAVFFG